MLATANNSLRCKEKWCLYRFLLASSLKRILLLGRAVVEAEQLGERFERRGLDPPVNIYRSPPPHLVTAAT